VKGHPGRTMQNVLNEKEKHTYMEEIKNEKTQGNNETRTLKIPRDHPNFFSFRSRESESKEKHTVPSKKHKRHTSTQHCPAKTPTARYASHSRQRESLLTQTDTTERTYHARKMRSHVPHRLLEFSMRIRVKQGGGLHDIRFPPNHRPFLNKRNYDLRLRSSRAPSDDEFATSP